MVVGGEDGQLGTGQHTAVAALGEQILMDGGKLLRIAVAAGLHIVIDKGHDHILCAGGGNHRFDAEGGELLLVQSCLDGAVGGQNAGALFALGHQSLGRFPNLELVDETVRPVDLWENAGEDSLEGAFFRILQEASQSADDETREKLELAARISRKILSGQEVKLP